MWNDGGKQQLGFIDALTVLSFVIAIENLQENREQSAHNDVQTANTRQERHLLKEVKKMFEEQNKMLREILVFLRNLTISE